MKILLNTYILGCAISTILCLIPILKSLISDEDVKPTLLDCVMLLSMAFLSTWFGVYSFVKYKVEETK